MGTHRQPVLVLAGALLSLLAAGALAGPPIPRSLSCQTYTEFEDGATYGPFEFWASGNESLSILRLDGSEVRSLQLGDVLYTWGGSKVKGIKRRLGTGLASLGLIRQIERVRNLGRWVDERVVDGQRYDIYEYEATATGPRGEPYSETVMAAFDSRSGAPKQWISTLTFPATGKASTLIMYFSDVEVNVHVASHLYDLPRNVEFVERN